jgi:hypothetical protein
MFKKNKINFSPAILKLEILLYQYIYIYYFILYYIRRAILIQKKKNRLRGKKNMPYSQSRQNIYILNRKNKIFRKKLGKINFYEVVGPNS